MDTNEKIQLKKLKSMKKEPRYLSPLERKTHEKQIKLKQKQKRKEMELNLKRQIQEYSMQRKIDDQWGKKERNELELLLLRIERDNVDSCILHAACAGYRNKKYSGCELHYFNTFDSGLYSPVFLRHACTRINKPCSVDSTIYHPSCCGYNLVRLLDSRNISPVFFSSNLYKIPLQLLADEQMENETKLNYDGNVLERTYLQTGATGARLQRNTIKLSDKKIELDKLMRSRFEFASSSESTSKTCKEDSESVYVNNNCRVCGGEFHKTLSQSFGCPSCFTYSKEKYLSAKTAESFSPRSRTPMTLQQEIEAKKLRFRALQMKMVNQDSTNQHKYPQSFLISDENDKEHEFYAQMLGDTFAIQKYRNLKQQFVTIHIKALPVGNFITLKLDTQSTIAYVYELYRANIENPNRPIHLLLPTSVGLFHLNESIESATDTRSGLINGEFTLEDFRLASQYCGSRRNYGVTTNSDFLLFSVAVLNEQSTPQLVGTYMQHNFKLSLPNNNSLPNASSLSFLSTVFSIKYATNQLPKSPSTDPVQIQVISHVYEMREFSNKTKCFENIDIWEQHKAQLEMVFIQEREEKLALKRKAQVNGNSRKAGRHVLRAIAYFEAICIEYPSSLLNKQEVSQSKIGLENPIAVKKNQQHLTMTTRRSVLIENERLRNVQLLQVEKRLEKLWHCFKIFEELKIIKNGNLIIAEKCAETINLLQKHQDEVVLTTEYLFHDILSQNSNNWPNPVRCISTVKKQFAIRLGERLGLNASSNREYGLLLDIFCTSGDTNNEEILDTLMSPGWKHDDTSTEAVEYVNDIEWTSSSAVPTNTLFTALDLLRSPFYMINWRHFVRAYRTALQVIPFHHAKLEEYNALARILYQDNVVLSKSQQAKWKDNVVLFLGTLEQESGNSSMKNSALAYATRQVLLKKGYVHLTSRRNDRNKQRQLELEESELLKKSQENANTPNLSVPEQLKENFRIEHRSKLIRLIDKSKGAKYAAKVGEIAGNVVSQIAAVANAVNDEYKTRRL